MSEIEQLRAILEEDESELAYEGWEVDGFETVHRNIYDTSRWSVVYEVVTQTPSGRYYRWYDEDPATEYQEGGDFSFNGGLEEVEPYVRASRDWRLVK